MENNIRYDVLVESLHSVNELILIMVFIFDVAIEQVGVVVDFSVEAGAEDGAIHCLAETIPRGISVKTIMDIGVFKRENVLSREKFLERLAAASLYFNERFYTWPYNDEADLDDSYLCFEKGKMKVVLDKSDDGKEGYFVDI